MARVKDKEPGVKLMGFGHPVYRNYDPRATIIKQAAHDVLERMGVNDPLLDIALRLEAVALADEYFISRKLYPNVDFYTGLIYKAMGFPTKMFTVLFALGRLPGWIAQWREMIEDPADQDRPPAAGLRRRAGTRLRAGGPALLRSRSGRSEGPCMTAYAVRRCGGPLRRDDLPPVRALAACGSRRSRWGCGTTSVTTSPWRPSARSCAGRSTSA